MEVKGDPKKEEKCAFGNWRGHCCYLVTEELISGVVSYNDVGSIICRL